MADDVGSAWFTFMDHYVPMEHVGGYRWFTDPAGRELYPVDDHATLGPHAAERHSRIGEVQARTTVTQIVPDQLGEWTGAQVSL